MDQHYVPKVYLKQFENSRKKIYILKNTAHKHSPYIKEVNKTQIAYIPDFYTINNPNSLWRLGVTNKDIIEKDYNSRVENRLEKLIAKLLASFQILSFENAQEALLILLSLKQRNPVFRQTFQNPQTILNSLSKRFNEVYNQRTIFEEILKREGIMDFDNAIEYGRNYMNQIAHDPNTPKTIHTEGIIKFYQKKDTFIHETAQVLLGCKWYIFETTPQRPFITSDNPGFCIDNNEQVNNLDFANSSGFFFPLNPRNMLMITAYQIDRIGTTKNVYHRYAHPKLVEMFNIATFLVSYKRVLSNDENTLRYLWQNISQYIPHLNDTPIYK